MIFTKEDLLGDYKWTSDPVNSLFTGSPTRRIFDRFNGAQVLFIINSYAALSESFTIEKARKIEELISNTLPLNTQSELSVFNWLRTEAPKELIS